MKLSELESQLETAGELNFRLPNGNYVPKHFHVTEVGLVRKHFIDCGGTVREEKTVSFQLWQAGDFDHRLAPQKLSGIIALSKKILGIEDGEIEVEYQNDTIGKYGLAFDGKDFLLTQKQTACLASDTCSTAGKTRINLSELKSKKATCCAADSNCC